MLFPMELYNPLDLYFELALSALIILAMFSAVGFVLYKFVNLLVRAEVRLADRFMVGIRQIPRRRLAWYAAITFGLTLLYAVFGCFIPQSFNFIRLVEFAFLAAYLNLTEHRQCQPTKLWIIALPSVSGRNCSGFSERA